MGVFGGRLDWTFHPRGTLQTSCELSNPTRLSAEANAPEDGSDRCQPGYPKTFFHICRYRLHLLPSEFLVFLDTRSQDCVTDSWR